MQRDLFKYFDRPPPFASRALAPLPGALSICIKYCSKITEVRCQVDKFNDRGIVLPALALLCPCSVSSGSVSPSQDADDATPLYFHVNESFVSRVAASRGESRRSGKPLHMREENPARAPGRALSAGASGCAKALFSFCTIFFFFLLFAISQYFFSCFLAHGLARMITQLRHGH